MTVIEQRILEMIQATPGIHEARLERVFGLSEVQARTHLYNLQREGEISVDAGRLCYPRKIVLTADQCADELLAWIHSHLDQGTVNFIGFNALPSLLAMTSRWKNKPPASAAPVAEPALWSNIREEDGLK